MVYPGASRPEYLEKELKLNPTMELGLKREHVLDTESSISTQQNLIKKSRTKRSKVCFFIKIFTFFIKKPFHYAVKSGLNWRLQAQKTVHETDYSCITLTWWCKPLIFQILTSWSNCHIIHALKYQRSTTIGCKDLKIRQSEFVASVQFPFPDIYKVPHICNTFISIWFLGTCRIKYLYFRIKYLYSRIIYICTSGLYISVLQD